MGNKAGFFFGFLYMVLMKTRWAHGGRVGEEGQVGEEETTHMLAADTFVTKD
jgi:hypothetical protein